MVPRRSPKDRALEMILHTLDVIDGMRYLSPNNAHRFTIHSGKISNHNMQRSEFTALLAKLNHDGIAEFNESDTGLSWGENRLEVHVPSWQKLTKYRQQITSAISGDQPVKKPVKQNHNTPDSFEWLHPKIKEKCMQPYKAKDYNKAAEKGFKIVRARLRELTTYERGGDAFGKGNLYIKGAAEVYVDDDFQQAVKLLTMSIDMFRNEKVHAVDGNIDNPHRALEYMTLSSLALHLLDNAVIKKKSA